MDIRNTIINNVLLAVQSLLNDQQLQAVQDALCIQLNSYEVQERSTELMVVDNTPDTMLAKYIATKRIEGKAESTIKRYYDTCYMMIMSRDASVINSFQNVFVSASAVQKKHFSAVRFQNIAVSVGASCVYYSHEHLLSPLFLNIPLNQFSSFTTIPPWIITRFPSESSK